MKQIDEPRRITHSENEEFLSRLKGRKTRLGIHEPKIEVRFEELCVEAKVMVGGGARPTLFNATINAAEEIMGLVGAVPSKKRPLKLLQGLKGIIKPSRMTLLLGPPGSGKSTLLRALAGKLDPSLKVSGRVTYNGKELTHFIPQRTCAYVTQNDIHHAEMTVRETLDFSRRVLGAGDTTVAARNKIAGIEPDPELDAFIQASSADENGRKFVTDYVLRMLGLYECADTIIGDEMRRGISGGQKKRVTIGEMLVGLAKTFFMDDISTGLDSSTTVEIMKFLKQMVHLMDLTIVISLLQPPPEAFDLFDDIILLCEGRIAYQGPRENVLEFFESMGFKCPVRKNTADFLQEVISKMDQAQYWANKHVEYQYIPVEKFVESFCSFRLGRLIENQLLQPFSQKRSDSSVLSKENYHILKWEQFKACFSRELLLMKRNSLAHLFKTMQISVLAFVVMTLFLRTNMNHGSIVDANRYMGAIFSGVVVINLNSMTELIIMIMRLTTFYRQKELLFLPSWAFLSSIFLLSIPMSLLETGIWTCSTYFVIGFAPSAIRFLQQFLAFFCIHQTSTSLFRFIAVVARTQVVANALGISLMVAIYTLGGFLISKDNLQSWWAWGNWVSPMTYAQNAVAIIEFLDKRWNMPISDRNINEDTIGKAFLRSRGLFTEWYWFWICMGALMGFSLLFNILCILALEYFKAPGKRQASVFIQSIAIDQTNMFDIEATTRASHKSGMVLPFQPITFAFSHISYYVDIPDEMAKHRLSEKKLHLLRDVSGAFKPGVLTALMGVTGAGKTTLLDVLAGRKTEGYIKGSIHISGYPKRQETFARISGYCEQTDIHSPFVTVRESLQYSAWLRLPSHIKPQIRNAFVDEVMDLVELKALENAMVGLAGINGLSTEQRKRLTIAVELVASPSIIFMDEPTSGLDARAAAIVMRTVRNTVDTGRTVVCTIHQPSIDIFESFDELLLMKRGGLLIYGGPLGPFSDKLVQYFEAVPGVPKIKHDQNPAAWVLDVSSSAMEYEIGIDFAEVFSSSYLYKKNMELIRVLSKEKSNSGPLYFPSKYTQSFRVQCAACLMKQHWSYWKDPEHNMFRFIITIASTLLFGTVFWDIGSKITTEQDLFNILGALYGAALFLGFPTSTMVQPIVWLERAAFYRETSAGMYSSMPYAIAQVAIEIPYIIIQVLIFSLIAYPMMGFQWAALKFFWFISLMFLNFMYFVLFGMVTVALTPNQEIAAILSFFFYVLWNLFSGFFIPRLMIPIWWRWFYWANPAAWTVYGLMVSQLGDRVDIIHIPGQSDQTVKDFLTYYLGLEANHFALVVALHVGIIVLFLLIFGFSIKHLNFQRR
ncbi:ABC transporter G family member 45-like [Tasmannia lanceolata]|uniref:ABC transporter G family member 45-like n=1 Tax=Tasmannia lanceolata TaxID=3420 RepID=UPI004062F4CE